MDTWLETQIYIVIINNKTMAINSVICYQNIHEKTALNLQGLSFYYTIIRTENYNILIYYTILSLMLLSFRKDRNDLLSILKMHQYYTTAALHWQL